jgi:hypothetical protein
MIDEPSDDVQEPYATWTPEDTRVAIRSGRDALRGGAYGGRGAHPAHPIFSPPRLSCTRAAPTSLPFRNPVHTCLEPGQNTTAAIAPPGSLG